MKSTEKKKLNNDYKTKELPLNHKIPLLASNNLENIIKNLSNPCFIGSIHMKKDTIPNSNLINNLVESELKSKMSHSIRSSLFNPITKILILTALIFNIFWILFIYVL